ncbi:MAG TPA: hypothetical protein ENJ19_06685 [Gammaproteobacteria bacterium]|nr:hypothetical protein [Gammaproteobacteria bacterium]
MRQSTFKSRFLDFLVASTAAITGAGIVYFGDKLTGVTLEYFFGVSTFSLAWITSLFLVPFVAGIVVSLVYGLGGKIIAHFSPLIVRGATYIDLHYGTTTPPPGVEVLPVAYWILVVIVTVEFAAFGGVIGEVLVKRTYGRSAKRSLHKKYQKSGSQAEGSGE